MGSKFKMPPHPAYMNMFEGQIERGISLSRADRTASITEALRKKLESFSSNRQVVCHFSSKLVKGKQVIPEELKQKEESYFTDEVVEDVFFRSRLELFCDIEMRINLYESGSNLFKIESSHWDETSSRKSISKIEVRDFKLPFSVCAIDISGAEWAGKYTLALISFFDQTGEDGQLIIRLENKKEEWFDFYIPFAKTIEEGLDSIKCPEEHKNTAYKILSIMMYASTFKREKNRFNERTVKARKTKGIPPYRINEIRLIQPEYFITKEEKERRKRRPQDVYYIVRGHWRSQPYGKREENLRKTIWIAPFWKGEERELVAKVYKV